MLTVISAVLVILWILGIVSTHMLGGWIHILLVIAIILILLRLIKGKPVM